MSIDINVNVTVGFKAETILELINGLMRSSPVRMNLGGPDFEKKPGLASETKPEIFGYDPSQLPTTPPVEKKKTRSEAKAALTAAVQAAADIFPDKGMPATVETYNLDDIRALCTTMAAQQDFDTKTFLKEQGYLRMSDIPPEEWRTVYLAAKAQEKNSF